MPKTSVFSVKSTEDNIAVSNFNPRRDFNPKLYTNMQVQEQLRLFNSTISPIFSPYQPNENVSLEEKIREQNAAIQLRKVLYANNKELYQKCQNKECELENIEQLIYSLHDPVTKKNRKLLQTIGDEINGIHAWIAGAISSLGIIYGLQYTIGYATGAYVAAAITGAAICFSITAVALTLLTISIIYSVYVSKKEAEEDCVKLESYQFIKDQLVNELRSVNMEEVHGQSETSSKNNIDESTLLEKAAVQAVSSQSQTYGFFQYNSSNIGADPVLGVVVGFEKK